MDTTLKNPLLPDEPIKHRVIRISTYAANVGGMQFCMTKCPSKHIKGRNIFDTTRQRWKYQLLKTSPRCCINCESNYLTPKEQKLVKKKLGIVANELGYWEDGKGCRLPREYRPEFCLSFSCFPYSVANPDKDLLNNLYRHV